MWVRGLVLVAAAGAVSTACGGATDSDRGGRGPEETPSSGGEGAAPAEGGGGATSEVGESGTENGGGATAGATAASGGVGGLAGAAVAGAAGAISGGGGLAGVAVAGAAGAISGEGGPAGEGGVAGEGGACPSLDCEQECLFGYWDGSDGCPTCACAPPPLGIEIDSEALDAAHATLETMGFWAPGSGDVTMWFTWTYDDPRADGEALVVRVGCGAPDSFLRLGSEPRTFHQPPPTEGSGLSCTADLRYSDLSDEWQRLTVQSGFVSLRAIDSWWDAEGGIYLELEAPSGIPGPLVVSGPFDMVMQ